MTLPAAASPTARCAGLRLLSSSRKTKKQKKKEPDSLFKALAPGGVARLVLSHWHLWKKGPGAAPGACPLLGVSALGRFSAGPAAAALCTGTSEERRSAWDASTVNARVWCITRLPGTSPGTSPSPLRDEAVGSPVPHQPNALLGAAKAGVSPPPHPPKEVISPEKSA